MLTATSPASVTVSGKPTQIRRPFSVSIYIGPEGGFTTREVDQAIQYGIVPVSLGPRILRAETAALATVAIVLHDLEEM